MKAQWQQLQGACTIPYRFPSDNPRKPTPTELSWIDLFYNSTPYFKKRAESDASVPDAPARAEKFAQRYTEIPEDLKDPKSHGGRSDCILLCRLREQVLRELGFQDIFKKVKGFIENKLIHPNAKGERRQRLALLIINKEK